MIEMILHSIATILTIVVIIIVLLSLNFDLTDYNKYISRINVRLGNGKLNDLLNGNGIGNLPSININSNNALVDRLQSCRDGPVYMGLTGSEFSCRQLCGSNASTIDVNSSDEIFSNRERLAPGVWCTINAPNCNLNTTYAVATVNSVTCRSRYPRMFGGDKGNTVIACNNQSNFTSENVLRDNLFNTSVNPFVEMQNEDERLPDGNFRFACRFGDDDFGNQYVSHPIDRLHPTRNFCSRDVFRASRQIRQMPDGTCDCGNYIDTRVRNRFQDDPFTPCTSCFHAKFTDRNQVGANCFTLFSPFNMAFEYPPCSSDRFIREGNFCETLNIDIQEQEADRPFEFHPIVGRSGTYQMVEGVFI